MTVSAPSGSTCSAFPLVLAVLTGVAFGALGTAAHQATIVVAGIAAPWGAILAIAGVATLLVGLRVEFRNRVAPLASAIGVVLTVSLFSFRSPGGSVLVPNNALGVVWSLAPAVLAIVVLCWPRLARRIGVE